MTKFLSAIKDNIKTMKGYEVTTVFTIATTSKQEKEPYATPIRKAGNFVVCGCVIFKQVLLLEINKLIDGNVDIILVDSEKKIPLTVHNGTHDSYNDLYQTSATIDFIETGNLSKICFNNIKKSKIYEYKPNDLTVNATWSFLSQKLKFLSGKKISILGAGNIGSKLALKLVECGAEVSIHRTNSYKGNIVMNGLNTIKPENTVSTIIFQENILQASFMSDVLIGATSGIQIITKDIIKSIKKGAIIVDLGKNTLTTGAINYAIEHNIEIYRTDITSALEGFIYEVLKMDNILQQSYGKKDLGYCTVVGGGYLGKSGDIVVDNIISPTRIFGVAQGDGTLKKEWSKEDGKKVDQLNLGASSA